MSFPGESAEYRQAREALLQAEVELRERIEATAALRRTLPLGGEVPTDYVFDEWDAAAGKVRQVAISELFDPGSDSLFLYSFMFIPGDRAISSRFRARRARRSSTGWTEPCRTSHNG